MQLQLTPYGYCECGCGGKAPLAAYSQASRGYVRGEPLRFISGHQHRPWAQRAKEHEVRDCGYATPCWVWTGNRDVNGYARLAGKLVHPVKWAEVNGAVPLGYELDHLCRNPPCVNPAHLEAVTHAENVRRGSCAILTVDQVREIRATRGRRGVCGELAERFGVPLHTIYKARSGARWKDI